MCQRFFCGDTDGNDVACELTGADTLGIDLIYITGRVTNKMK